MAATIKQVAKLAGVSTATVSKYLNGVRLKEKNRAAVEDAIHTLDFHANEFARNLRTQKSMTVGVLIPELDNIFSTQIISHIENTLMEHGYSTIICDYKTNPSLERQKLDFLKQKMADALVIMPYGLTKEDVQNCNVPVVFIDRAIPGAACDSVLVDNVQAAYLATEYLLLKGHKRIGVLCGPQEIYTAQKRLEGYQKALLAHGVMLETSFILHGGYDVKSGYQLTQRMLRQKNRPTALLATNHEITAGAVMALNELGLKIPADISLIGFDNRELADALHPRLTIVLQPIEEIGKNVAQILIRALTDGNHSKQSLLLKAELLVQDSVKVLT